MIIDSHAHIAHWPTLKESEECIEESNKKYLIGFTLVSDCDCSEYPSVDKYGIHHVSQLQGLRTTLAFVKKDPKSLGAMVWVNPHNEVVTPADRKSTRLNS